MHVLGEIRGSWLHAEVAHAMGVNLELNNRHSSRHCCCMLLLDPLSIHLPALLVPSCMYLLWLRSNLALALRAVAGLAAMVQAVQLPAVRAKALLAIHDERHVVLPFWAPLLALGCQLLPLLVALACACASSALALTCCTTAGFTELCPKAWDALASVMSRWFCSAVPSATFFR